jgi:hypothetical protein
VTNWLVYESLALWWIRLIGFDTPKHIIIRPLPVSGNSSYRSNCSSIIPSACSLGENWLARVQSPELCMKDILFGFRHRRSSRVPVPGRASGKEIHPTGGEQGEERVERMRLLFLSPSFPISRLSLLQIPTYRSHRRKPIVHPRIVLRLFESP